MTFLSEILLKPEDGGNIKKEYNSEDLLKLKDEIIKAVQRRNGRCKGNRKTKA